MGLYRATRLAVVSTWPHRSRVEQSAPLLGSDGQRIRGNPRTANTGKQSVQITRDLIGQSSRRCADQCVRQLRRDITIGQPAPNLGDATGGGQPGCLSASGIESGADP